MVTFQSPVNFNRWKLEHLQIQMEAAPFRSKREKCRAEEVCVMSWYTPMPLKNGSVVIRVDVSSNSLGPFIPDKRFQVNINGFLQRQPNNKLQLTVGHELFSLKPRYFLNVTSRPLWYTVDQAPVLILGGIPDEKSILLTDTNFEDFFLVELSIDSCWVGSFYCPQASFTGTIYDAIATESTLFIRQNQLVYYFTGTYTTLHESNHGSGSWVRVLATECIKKLCPVHFHSNGSEYIIALTIGKNEGYVHFGTITDGYVSFEMLPRQQSVCERIQVFVCSINWAIYVAGDNHLLLLVEIQGFASKKYFQVVSYDLVTDYLAILYTIPEFIPDARGLEFLMILGTESYTSFSMVPKGMSYNPYNKHYFDCVHVDLEMPCFHFRDTFYPFFLIQDMATGDSGSFKGSYVLKVVGGGPNVDNIKEYSEEEIYRFNSPLDNTNSLIWTTKNTTMITKDSAFSVMSHQSLGIKWLCLENSPCYDTIPHSIFAPEFFFKVSVSNRGVDQSTYCDYQLIFLLHIHGLPLSAKRSFIILMISTSIFLSLVILYIIFCLLLPLMAKTCNILRWKIKNIITSEFYYTHSSSSRVFSSTSETRSSVSSRSSFQVVEKNKPEPEKIVKKPLT
uniref:Cation channel sperm associated auxiliary subunit gamma n=1 Tax=Rousettus aegyptiacus TaxID=9407 RepID=A0A7J8CEJ2_ROUAE|nr:cation channel sperm associated auxiliary subunit gamma [Rousettus aegyptiacus]